MSKYFNRQLFFTAGLQIFCLLTVSSALVYRVYALNTAGIFIALVLTASGFFVICRYFLGEADNRHHTAGVKTKTELLAIIWRAAHLSSLAAGFFILYRSQTEAAIISPWQAVPYYFFFIFGLSLLFLFLLVNRGDRHLLPHISLQYFLSFSAAWIVYGIGYGFDPFIHRATESLIATAGSVDPKPFYYLGQYGLVVILHKITALPVDWLDKLLVPVLAAVFLPYYLLKMLGNWLDDKKTALVTTLVLLALPFSFFIVTTPQNLAYLFLLLAIIVGVCCRDLPDLVLVYLLALAALAVQPIAGIPAIFFSLFLTVYHGDRNKFKKIFYAVIFLLVAVSLPLAFYFVGQNQTAGADEPAASESVWQLFKPVWPDKENFILNFIYLIGFNLPLLILLLALSGGLIAYRYREKCRATAIYAGMVLALLLSYLVTKLLPFGFLIIYERSDFPNRILAMAALFALPFFLLALYRFIYDLQKQPRAIRLSFLLLAVILMLVSLYLSYPRFDRYFNSHLFAVSRADIEAVHWIDDNAQNDFIVLSNQQVSAAALQEFGFKKYYEIDSKTRDNVCATSSAESLVECRMPEAAGDPSFEIRNSKFEIFYYPIPTGGPLYRHYLDMVYEKPSRATMMKAMDLVGVNEGYFVLNKYWWAFPKILAEAKIEADAYEEIDKGEIYVFKYIKNP